MFPKLNLLPKRHFVTFLLEDIKIKNIDKEFQIGVIDGDWFSTSQNGTYSWIEDGQDLTPYYNKVIEKALLAKKNGPIYAVANGLPTYAIPDERFKEN